MTVRELIDSLERAIPRSLSCEWDNDGAMCVPDPDKNVGCVLVTLDVTEDVIEHARTGEYDVIVSHHPLVFKGQKSLTTEQNVQRKLIALVKAGIACASYHTRFDSIDGGVSDALADAIGLADRIPFGDAEAPAAGRVGELPKANNAEELAAAVRDALSAPAVNVADAGRQIRRVAVVGGEGGDFIGAAVKAGADALVTGRAGYHNAIDAAENGLTVIEAGHYHTEARSLRALERVVKKCAPQIETGIYANPPIKTI